jgi:hypothetical protein
LTTLAYLFDENVDPRLQTALHRRSPDCVVWPIGDPGAPPLHTDDPTILVWCEANGFVLVTNNRSSMPIHLRDHLDAGRHVPGIVILRTRVSLGDLADELALMCEASDADEYADRMVYVPLDR